MNKTMANKGSHLEKNMTHSDSLVLTNLKATQNMVIPVYVDPLTPPNPTDGCIYIKKIAVGNYAFVLYLDGGWH